MKKIKKLLNIILFPHIAAVIAFAPVAAVLLIYCFSTGQDDSALAYVSYIFSAYTLTIICARMPTVIKRVKAFVHRSEHAHRYLTDALFRTHISLYMSLGINLLYVAIKLFSGIYYKSAWFISLAVYYIILAVMRFLLLRHVNRSTIGQNIPAELKRYRVCGAMLLIMNIALLGIVVLVITQNKGFEYAGMLIYVMAAYAFYMTITAIVNIVKFRKYNSPVLSASKAINLVAAMVSMLSLETAMITRFGDNDDMFRTMTGMTGGAVSIIVLSIAVFMLISSTIRLKRLRKETADKKTEISE